MNEKIKQMMLKLSIGGFAKMISYGKFLYPKHIELLDKSIIQAVNKGNSKLMINMPPRHGKSEFISKYFPAWYLLNFPDKRIILTSYEAHFAQSWGKKVRDIIEEYGKEFSVYLDPSMNSVSSFAIRYHSGVMSCVGAGGAITGKGADMIIVDDPIKNDAEANSETIRDNIRQWFKSTVLTRLEPNGSIIMVMTRWHEDDICGSLLAEAELNEWQHINLPAIAYADDPIGRNEGEALWSDRFNIEKLLDIKRTIGEYWFSALYQQEPSPKGGGIFKGNCFKYYAIEHGEYVTDNSTKLKESELKIFATVDLAATTKENSDFTVILTFATDGNGNILLLDIVREKFESLRHKEVIMDAYNKWKHLLIGVESVQYQISLVNELMHSGLPVKALRPNKDKLSRALSMQAKLESGKIYLPKYAAWLSTFINELEAFPNAKHDDQVDCFSYITNILEPISGTLPVGLKRIFRK